MSHTEQLRLILTIGIAAAAILATTGIVAISMADRPIPQPLMTVAIITTSAMSGALAIPTVTKRPTNGHQEK